MGMLGVLGPAALPPSPDADPTEESLRSSAPGAHSSPAGSTWEDRAANAIPASGNTVRRLRAKPLLRAPPALRANPAGRLPGTLPRRVPARRGEPFPRL